VVFSSPDPKVLPSLGVRRPSVNFFIFQKRALLPYVLFLVTAAMFVGRMEPNEEVA
jgi:hypothetical protein